MVSDGFHLMTDSELQSALIALPDGHQRMPNGSYRFNCPYCHQSRKSKKASAYFYRGYTDWCFKCFNCGASPDKFYKDYIPKKKKAATNKSFKYNPTPFKQQLEQRKN